MNSRSSFSYHRNNLVSFGKDVRLWNPIELDPYNYRVTFSYVSAMNMSFLGRGTAGLYTEPALFYSPGGLYNNVRKHKMILPGMFASLMFPPFYRALKARRLYKRMIRISLFLLRRERNRKRRLTRRKLFDIANAAYKRHSLGVPVRYRVLLRIVKVTRLFNVWLFFRKVNYQRQKYDTFFTRYFYWKHRLWGKGSKLMQKTFTRLRKRLYYKINQAGYGGFEILLKVPHSAVNRRNLDGFYAYCKLLFRNKRIRFPGNTMRGIRTKLYRPEYARMLRQSHLRRRKVFRYKDTRFFHTSSWRQWHNITMTQMGLKPEKWWFSTIKKHRQYDWSKNKYVRRQAKFHIEEKFHGQLRAYESMIGRTLELSKNKVYAFFRAIIRRMNAFKLGLLLLAISKRLDLYPRKYFPQLRLSSIRKIIRSGVVVVNNARITDINYTIDACDVVQLDSRGMSRRHSVPSLRGVDLLYNHYFVTLYFVLYTGRQRWFRRVIKLRIIKILHRMLRWWYEHRMPMKEDTVEATRMKLVEKGTDATKYRFDKKDALEEIKYWGIRVTPRIIYERHRPHWLHPYDSRHAMYRDWSLKSKVKSRYNIGSYSRSPYAQVRGRSQTGTPRFNAYKYNRGRYGENGATYRRFSNNRFFNLGWPNRCCERWLIYLEKCGFVSDSSGEKEVRYGAPKKRLFSNSNYAVMRGSAERQYMWDKRGGMAHAGRAKRYGRRPLFGTRFASRVEKRVYNSVAHSKQKQMRHLPMRERIVRMHRVISSVEAITYIYLFTRLFTNKVSLYVNPQFVEHPLSVSRMFRVSYGVAWTRSIKAEARARRAFAIGRASLHVGYSFWDRVLDNLYNPLQLLLPSRQVEVVSVSNYSFYLRYDVGTFFESEIPVQQDGLLSIPLTSHMYANAVMFKRFIQDKTQVRRTFAHSPFVTSRHVLFGPNRDTYMSYI